MRKKIFLVLLVASSLISLLTTAIITIMSLVVGVLWVGIILGPVMISAAYFGILWCIIKGTKVRPSFSNRQMIWAHWFACWPVLGGMQLLQGSGGLLIKLASE